MVVGTRATRPVVCSTRRRNRNHWRKIRKGAAWLMLGGCGVATLHAPLVATPVVSFPAYTSPTEMDGTNPQLITLTMSTASAPSTTDTFDTLAIDGVLNWTVSGTTWSGNPITPDLLTASIFAVTAVGDLFAPLNSPAPLTASVVNNSSPTVGEANFSILSNGAVNVGVPYQAAPIGTMNFTVAADVQAATFTFAFSPNTNFSFFTEPTTFAPVSYSSGGGSITVVPEPTALVTVGGVALGCSAVAASAWRKRRRTMTDLFARG